MVERHRKLKTFLNFLPTRLPHDFCSLAISFEDNAQCAESGGDKTNDAATVRFV